MITSGGFVYTFGVAALLILVPAVLYYVLFDALETRTRGRAPTLVRAMAGGQE